MVTLLVFFLLFIAIVSAEFFLTSRMGASEDSSPISQLFDLNGPLQEILVAQN